MGDIADYYIDRYLDDIFSESEENKDFSIWTMRNGEEIKITDMTVSHLKNTINMLKRNRPNHAWIKYLEIELKKRK